MSIILNSDGTVDLSAAERILETAERAFASALGVASRAERAVEQTPSYRIEHGRNQQRLEQALAGVDAAYEAIKRARGLVHEALNPDA